MEGAIPIIDPVLDVADDATEEVADVAQETTEPVTDIIETTTEAVSDAISQTTDMLRIENRLNNQDQILASIQSDTAAGFNNLLAALNNIGTTAVETVGDVAETAAEVPADTIETIVEGDPEAPFMKRKGRIMRRKMR